MESKIKLLSARNGFRFGVCFLIVVNDDCYSIDIECDIKSINDN